jgi:Peptidase C13 family
MLKRLALISALLGATLAAPGALAQGGDPLRGQFGAVELAMTPAAAADDVTRMADALSKLAPQRPGIVDTYVLSASFWNDPVFEREASEAAGILARRYDASDRTIILSAGKGQNAPRIYPSSGPNNFNAALGRIGKIIDPKEDLVVVFVTSHGGQDGAVAIQETGRMGGAMRATHLRTSLMQAGINTKLVIVSACFSGHFILPFSNPDTVVLTAAAADKTSFGCEPSRDWTFFGDALFNHTLRSGKPLLEAYDGALTLITKWENDLHAEWAALTPTQRSRQPEILPSNPQRNAGEAALVVVTKAESYGNAIACAGHLSFALDRAKTGRPLKGLADVAALTSAQGALQGRATSEGMARGRSAQDTAKSIAAVSASVLQVYNAQQVADVTAHAAQCMAP